MKNPEDKTTERRENSQDFQMLPLKYSLMRTDQCIYVRKPEARGKKKPVEKVRDNRSSCREEQE